MDELDDDLAQEVKTKASRTDIQNLAIEMVEAGMNDSAIANALCIGRRTLYTWKTHDEAFKARYKKAKEIIVDHLIQEAKRRAMNGSDRLLEFMLCNLAPDQFSKREKLEVDAQVNVAEILAKARKRAGKNTNDDGQDLI